MNIIQALEQYEPYNEQEEKDRQNMILFADANEKVFSRENTSGHFTASGWIVNKERTKVLMIYHNLYDSWSWTGGHADEDQNLLQVAMREAIEETGIQSIHPLKEDIFSIEIATVDGHMKNGKYISSHLHYNITYLFEADEEQTLIHKPDENSDVKWFELDAAIQASSEPWFRKWIYQKLNKKLLD